MLTVCWVFSLLQKPRGKTKAREINKEAAFFRSPMLSMHDWTRTIKHQPHFFAWLWQDKHTGCELCRRKSWAVQGTTLLLLISFLWEKSFFFFFSLTTKLIYAHYKKFKTTEKHTKWKVWQPCLSTLYSAIKQIIIKHLLCAGALRLRLWTKPLENPRIYSSGVFSTCQLTCTFMDRIFLEMGSHFTTCFSIHPTVSWTS